MGDATGRSYTPKEVAAALEMNPATLQQWLARGVVQTGDCDHPGTGRRRAFTFNSAVQVAIMSRLVDAGLLVSAAAEIASGARTLPNGIAIEVDRDLIKADVLRRLQEFS